MSRNKNWSKEYMKKFLALNPGAGNKYRRMSLGSAHELFVCGHLLKIGFDVLAIVYLDGVICFKPEIN